MDTLKCLIINFASIVSYLLIKCLLSCIYHYFACYLFVWCFTPVMNRFTKVLDKFDKLVNTGTQPKAIDFKVNSLEGLSLKIYIL